MMDAVCKSMIESEASMVASDVSIVDEEIEENSVEEVDSSEVVENGKEEIKLDDSTSDVSVVIGSKVVSRTDLVNSVDNDSNTVVSTVVSTADVDDT